VSALNKILKGVSNKNITEEKQKKDKILRCGQCDESVAYVVSEKFCLAIMYYLFILCD
jgi:hypothetical protein